MTFDPMLPMPLLVPAAAAMAIGGVLWAFGGPRRGQGRTFAIVAARLGAVAALSVLFLRPMVTEDCGRAEGRPLRPFVIMDASAPKGELEGLEALVEISRSTGPEALLAAVVPGRRDVMLFGSEPARLAPRAASVGLSVWAVIPEQEEPRELRLGPLSIVPPTPRADEPIVASSELELLAPRPMRARLGWFLDGRREATQELELRTGPNRVEHAFLCPAAGLHRLRLEAEPLPGELDVSDNASGAFFEVLAGPVRVLIVEGPPRPVYRALRRALSAGEGRGFALRASSAIERYRAPGPIPAENALDEFDLVILGDVCPGELPPGALERLAGWLRRGGGLLLIAGQRNLEPGGWADILPIEPLREVRKITGPFEARPAGRVGDLRPFPFGALRTGLVPRLSWRTFPELEWVYEVGVREGASATVVAARPGLTLPLLVHWQLGRGRAAVLLSDDIPRWAEKGGQSRIAHDEFWRDLVAGLARAPGAGGHRLWIEAGPPRGDLSRRIPFKVFVTDPSAEVLVRFEPAGLRAKGATELRLGPGSVVRTGELALEEGVGGTLLAAIPGGAESRFELVPRQSTRPNLTPAENADLEAICAASGGKRGGPELIRAFLEKARPVGVPAARMVVLREVVPPGLILALFIVLYAAEWFLRKDDLNTSPRT